MTSTNKAQKRFECEELEVWLLKKRLAEPKSSRNLTIGDEEKRVSKLELS